MSKKARRDERPVTMIIRDAVKGHVEVETTVATMRAAQAGDKTAEAKVLHAAAKARAAPVVIPPEEYREACRRADHFREAHNMVERENGELRRRLSELEQTLFILDSLSAQSVRRIHVERNRMEAKQEADGRVIPF